MGIGKKCVSPFFDYVECWSSAVSAFLQQKLESLRAYNALSTVI